MREDSGRRRLAFSTRCPAAVLVNASIVCTTVSFKRCGLTRVGVEAPTASISPSWNGEIPRVTCRRARAALNARDTDGHFIGHIA